MYHLKHYTTRILMTGILGIFMVSCSSKKAEVPAPKEEAPQKEVQETTPQINQQLTRNVQLIAGMDTLLDYEHPEWNHEKIKSFARDVNSKFAHMQSARLDKISGWNKENLQRTGKAHGSFCFYPFSGGDFVHAKWLYPEANEYLLVAMEPVGTIPDLTVADNKEVLSYLDNVDDVLRDIYKRSYFITKNMEADIKDSNRVNGMFPIIMWAAARSNHEVISIDYFNIDTMGQTTVIDPKDVTAKSRAVEVQLMHKPTGETKTITYLSADISDKGFKKHPGIKKYLEGKVPQQCNSFVKSASYLMHYSTFSQIRNIVLAKSDVLVQDDTGIPFDKFDQDQWTVELYGEYEKPVKDFSERLYQEDLDSAYQDDQFYKGRLNFSLGYHWGSKKQNEMFIHRK